MSEALRPLSFKEYKGQSHLLPMLKVMVAAAKKRGDAVGHLLFSGPAGLGKTTIAQIVANEIGTKLHVVNAPTITSGQKLKEILFRIQENDVLFIDEIHRLNMKVEELLYPVVEDFTVELTVGDETNKRVMQVPMPKFTLIGATTRQGLVSTPMRTRFQQIFQMRYYEVEALTGIVHAASEKLGMEMTYCGAEAVACRARGTPRIAIKLLKTMHDYATAYDTGRIDGKFSSKVLNELGIDNKGLGHLERFYLQTLVEKFDSKPTGVETLSAAIGESVDTLEEIEAYLLRIGFLNRGSRGRQPTDKAVEHLRSDQ